MELVVLISSLLSLGMILPGPVKADFEANLDHISTEALSNPEVEWIHAPRARTISGTCSAPAIMRLKSLYTRTNGIVISLDLKETYGHTFYVANSETGYPKTNSGSAQIYSQNGYLHVYNTAGSRKYYSRVIKPGTVKITLQGNGRYAVHQNDKLITESQDSGMFTFPLGSKYIYVGMNTVANPSYAGSGSYRGRGVCSVNITWLNPDFHVDLTYSGWSIPSNTPEIQWRSTPSKPSSTYRNYCQAYGALRLVKSPVGAIGVKIDMTLKDVYQYAFHLADSYYATGFGRRSTEIHNKYKDFYAYRSNKQLLALVPEVIVTGQMNITLMNNGVTMHVNNKLVYKSEADLMFKFPVTGDGINIGLNRLINSSTGKGLCSLEITWLYASLSRRDLSEDGALIDMDD